MVATDVLQRGLWGCSVFLQAALVLRILDRNLLYRLSWFLTWLVAEIAFAILFIWTPMESWFYYHLWNLSQPLLSVLRVAVGWELVHRIADVRTGRSFTPYHALGLASVLVSLALAFVSLRIERAVLQGFVWAYGVVLLNRAVWTSIALVAAALLTMPRVHLSWSLDRNTAVHASLLLLLASAETGRYLVAACSHGRLTAAANMATLLLESALFGAWIVLLRPEDESPPETALLPPAPGHQ